MHTGSSLGLIGLAVPCLILWQLWKHYNSVINDDHLPSVASAVCEVKQNHSLKTGSDPHKAPS